MFSFSALKSGINVSNVVAGFKDLIALIVLYQTIEPPSLIHPYLQK
jgi:hypothetical protein